MLRCVEIGERAEMTNERDVSPVYVCLCLCVCVVARLHFVHEQGSLLDKLDENTRVGALDTLEDDEEEEEEDDLWRDNKENTEGAALQNAGRNTEHAGGAHCKDEELEQLEKDVAALAARLHEHRTKVPKLLESKVEAEVVALRPKVRFCCRELFILLTL